MGRTHRRTRRKRHEIHTQPKFSPQRRTPHSVVPLDRANDGDPNNEFVHDDDWLTPYEPADDAL